MTPEIIEINITYGKTLTFFLRMIGISDEQKLRQKTFGLKESEKAEKEYDANVQLLADLSEKIPTGLFDDAPDVREENDQTVYADSFKEPSAMIRAYFAEKTVTKERVAFYAVRAYFTRLAPSDFF